MTPKLTSLLIYKAQSIGDTPLPGCEIVITEPIPNGGNDLRTQQDLMRQEAAALVTALRGTLPQGTWSQFVALVAQAWAADQYGIISAQAWYEPK